MKHSRSYWESHITTGNVKYGDNGIYIGRPMRGREGSPLGNPFHLRRESDRDMAIQHYQVWLGIKLAHPESPQSLEIQRLADLAQSQGHLELVCWCKPAACHGDVIRQVILNRIGK